MNLGEAPSVASFDEKWPLACFCAPKPLFWLIKWWRFRIWCRGKPICGGAPFFRRFPVKVVSTPLCAANPPGLVRVVFLAVSPGRFSGCIARSFFLAVSPGRFSGCVAKLFFLLCRQVVFLVVSPGLLLTVSSGCFWLVLPGFVF